MKMRASIRILLAAAVLMLASCATPHRRGGDAAGLARCWPAPPARPRIAFLQQIRGPADIGQHPSIWRAMTKWITGDNAGSLNLRKPFAVAVDEKGNLCIADTEAGLVVYCDFERIQWRSYRGAGKVKFASPVAVACAHGALYVADSELGKVFAFREDGAPIFEIGAPLKRPVGLALAGDSLAVVDAQAHSVILFSLDGMPKSSFGRRGSGPGELNYPTSIAFDKHEQFFVTDTLNSRVEVFDLRGNFVSEFGSNGDTGGHFARPKGIALDHEGHVYVVDGLLDNFQIFDPTGQLLLGVGERGEKMGEFGLPNGMAISADNRIFVADAYNHRVQVFQYLEQP